MLLQFILPEVLTLLKATVKNPHSVSHLNGILTEIRDTINLLLPSA